MGIEPGTEDVATPPDAGQVDWFLQYLVAIVDNSEELSLGITLQLGGQLVSGFLVNEKYYFEGFADEFAAMSILHSEEREQLRESFATFGSAYQHDTDERDTAPPQFLHLKNAAFCNASGEPVAAVQGTWWRGRVSEVRSFTLGVLRNSTVETAGLAPGRMAIQQPDVLSTPPGSDPLWKNPDILEYTQDAIFIWEMHGEGILYWNRAAEHLYGYSRSEALGRTSHVLLNTQVDGGIPAVEDQLARFGVWAGTLRHRGRHGRVVPVQARLSLLSQRNGRWLVIEVNRDIAVAGDAEPAAKSARQTDKGG